MSVLAVATGVSVGSAAGATDQTVLPCEGTALAQAFDTGGNYTFAADCTLSLSASFVLHSGTSLTLSAGGHAVIFRGTDGGGGGSGAGYGNGNRFAEVAGTLDLYGVTLDSFGVGGATLNGTAGTNGAAGADASVNDQPGGNGEDGGRGGDGKEAHGGALLIDPGADVTLVGVTLTNDFAHGGNGGNGGVGGNGGFGGLGAPGSGTGAPGGKGGDGGDGGNGGDAYGGAIENDGTLAIVDGTITGDLAEGGVGNGGNGGEGGEGGDGGVAEPEQIEGTGGVGGAGGNGGAPGHTGASYGGAIYNTGTLTVTNTFFNNDNAGYYSAISYGGWGGYGGKGGAGQWDLYSTDPSKAGSGPGSGGNGGAGGDGGLPGTVGISVGGDIYSTSAYTVTGGTAHGLANPGKSCSGAGELGGTAGGYITGSYNDGKVPASLGSPGAPGTPTTQTCDSGQTSGNAFFPDPNPGEPGEGTGGETGGGSENGGSGTGGNGSPGNGAGSTGTGGSGSGSGGSGSGGSGSGSGGSGSGAGGPRSGGSGGGGHATTGNPTTSGTTASLPARCPASGPNCTLTGELMAAGVSGNSLEVSGGDRSPRKALLLGRATVTIPHGHSGTLKVKLGAGGRRLLAARHRLNARLVVTQRVAGKQTVVRSGAVRFRL